MTRRVICALLAAAAFAAAASAVAPQSHGAAGGPSLAARCGIERWPVKTLTDADAGSVRLVPVATSLTELREEPLALRFQKLRRSRHAGTRKTGNEEAEPSTRARADRPRAC